jgi:hypothetical protein
MPAQTVRLCRRSMATLPKHVLRVVRDRADKEMIRPNTGRIVAVMAHDKSFWNRAVVQLPAKTMGAFVETLLFGRPANDETPISFRRALARPQPAPVRLLNELPKPLP